MEFCKDILHVVLPNEPLQKLKNDPIRFSPAYKKSVKKDSSKSAIISIF
jgi:hypothetical protein